MNMITVEHLTVAFPTERGILRAVDDVSLSVEEGELFALSGESGCGKSTLAFAFQNLIPSPGYIERGRIRIRGRDLSQLTPNDLRRLRGAEVAMVFQASMASFNPVLRFRDQIDHMLEAHPEVWRSERDAMKHMERLLEMVQLPAQRVLAAYPHELSGGMKQRFALALSLLLKPPILILDEPTTALDVINQRVVLEILHDLHQELNLTVVFVTHDLGVVAELATRVAVMYAGKLVDLGGVDQVFYDERRHPYVLGLMNAVPSVVGDPRSVRSIPGGVPDLVAYAGGCRFAPRCPIAEEACREEEPALVDGGGGHMVACRVVVPEAIGERRVKA